MTAQKIIKVCKGCGTTFEPKHQSTKRRKAARFCSRACAKRGRPTKSYRLVYNLGKNRRAHRIRAEAALGHPLPVGVVVHHVDGTKDETSPLVICQDQAYHMLLHRRMRIKAAGGDPNTDSLCGICHLTKPVGEFGTNTRMNSGLCRFCKTCAPRRAVAKSRPRSSETPSG